MLTTIPIRLLAGLGALLLTMLWKGGDPPQWADQIVGSGKSPPFGLALCQWCRSRGRNPV